MLPDMGIFAIDASCIVGLDNKHVVLTGQQPATPEFAEAEQAAIWDGLEQLAANGRLKVIPAVASELRLRNPEGLARLTRHTATRAARTNPIRLEYQELIDRYPDWAPRGDENWEQGDPWLVAFAMVRGYCVVTDEKPKRLQRARRRNNTKIPDVCDIQSVPHRTLRKLAEEQGWIK